MTDQREHKTLWENIQKFTGYRQGGGEGTTLNRVNTEVTVQKGTHRTHILTPTLSSIPINTTLSDNVRTAQAKEDTQLNKAKHISHHISNTNY
jgi:hypothetical protein